MTVNERPDNLPLSPRRYHSPKRRQQADATRRRILIVAEQLFAAQGFATVTMEAVARAATVSLATVYLHFSSRTALVGALADEIVAAPDLSVDQVLQAGDPVEQLRIAARAIRRLNERSWLVVDILRTHRGSDPELARLWALWQQRHLEATRRGIEAISERGALRSELSVEEAADEYYAIAGTEVYRALIQERGWPPQQYERWLFQMSCRELLAQPCESPRE